MNKILQEEPDDNKFDIREKRKLERNTAFPDENWVLSWTEGNIITI